MASPADLDEIRATQQKLLNARVSGKLPRDEVPLEEVKLAKRQLLEWAEAKLQSSGRNANPADLTKALTKELDEALKRTSRDQDQDLLGQLNVGFARPMGEPAWIQMSTGIGIPCGIDRSVYLYEWRDNHWNRRFALEADDYRRDQYGPQEFVELQVSSPDRRGARLVLVTGWPPACISVWQTLYIRLFRVDESQTMLLEETPLANEGEDNFARLERSGALVEFSGFSIDAGNFIRKYALHYKVDGNKIRRIDPIALSPQDFVDEWLTHSWAEMKAWSNPGLAAQHTRLHKDGVGGYFDSVKRCTESRTWQVAIDLNDQTTYFLVADRGQYSYRMIGIGENPRADCSGKDELLRLGSSKPTLFPKN